MEQLQRKALGQDVKGRRKEVPSETLVVGFKAHF
jgi:hypothetical protein